GRLGRGLRTNDGGTNPPCRREQGRLKPTAPAREGKQMSKQNPAEHAVVPISFGELIDKITILEIKAARFEDAQKLANVRNELELLNAVLVRFGVVPAEVEIFKADLQKINETLWETEDRIRECESKRQFGQEFIELARTVYKTNDRRSAVKRWLNELVGS